MTVLALASIFRTQRSGFNVPLQKRLIQVKVVLLLLGKRLSELYRSI